MTDLVEFLRARLDEDERAAQAITEPNRAWRVDVTASEEDGAEYSLDLGEGRDILFVGYGEDLSRAEAEHIARHDPARVLAEVAAKRRIVDQSEDAQRNAADPTPEQLRTQEDWAVIARTYEYAVRLLALPHAGHPDYREEWRP